jgi:hypothetical protein
LLSKSLQIKWRIRVVLAGTLAVLAVAGLTARAVATDGTNCATAANPIVCENQLPGTAPSNWEVQGVGDPTIQGYATQMSGAPGQTISFKIDTPSTAYHIDILRLGWYGGDGARIVASDIEPSATLPQSQPACMTDSSTGEIDCGNWSMSASWTVPSDAVSGIYIAHLVRDDSQDPGGASQIPFVVTQAAGTPASDILVPTDDETWEAYNDYGGNSLYTCTVACPPGNPGGYKAAYAVSYNRPWDGGLQTDGGASYLWYAEYQTVQFLERNGYDVSYTDDANLASAPAPLLSHKTLLFSGHDEYWSAGERSNVTAARDAGVNLAFFTGNEIFWKTRWGASIDGSNTPYRTLTTYKETHFDAPVDPDNPPTWTGTWADPRFSPPADGDQPANSLTGQMFEVNSGTADITVPFNYSKLPIWQNTSIASLSKGQTATLGAGDGTLGYEWDVDADNGFRPPGEFDLSSTTVNGVQAFTDYGTNATGSTATETHNLSLYRAASGALVFGAGTVQWSWGLDNFNAWGEWNTEPSGNPPDPNMEQATVNLLALMGTQPNSLQSGLVPASPPASTTPPSSTITAPASGSSIADGSTVTISGTAGDSSGAVVAGVEVSTDGGKTWHPATLTTPDGTTVSWSYSWIAHGYPSTTLETRAVDGDGHIETPSDARQVTITCPCSLWGTNVNPTTVPYGQVDSGDGSSVEVGVQFTGSIDAEVTGVRFYKAAANTGTHVGDLWSASGTLLAQGTFTKETASGWQTLTFASPVVLQAGKTYAAGYYAPNGHYSITPGWFYPQPAPTPLGGATDTSGPWSSIVATGSNENGVFAYGGSPSFPTSTYGAANYWVDPILSPVAVPGKPGTPTASANSDGTVTVNWPAPTSGGPATSYVITPFAGSSAKSTTTVSGAPAATTATISGLTPGTTYTFTVQASNTSGSGTVSAHSNSATPGKASVPSVPGGVSASPASGEALVSWTAAGDGGSPITGYTITVTAAGGSSTQVQISGGDSTTQAMVTGLSNGTSYTFTVAATNSVGNSAASSASAAVLPQDTLFDFQTPANVDSGDGSAVNVGVEFQASQNGQITGVRFYKTAANTGTHIGDLWSTSGSLLAQGTFTNETGSGWQTLVFSSPVSVTAGTTYIASYVDPNGHYSYNADQFASPITNGPLTAPASSSLALGNDVYSYGATPTFPTSTYNADNFWVDVLFQPAGSGGGTTTSTTTTSTTTTTTTTASVPSVPGGVSASPASGEALVSWTAAGDGGSPITGYTITVTAAGGSSTQVQISGGDSTTQAMVTGLSNGTSYTFTVAATNSVGNSAASSASAAVLPQDTLFDFQTPANVDSGDGSAVNVGVEFQASQNGQITGVRFYKTAANTGTHIGDLWSTSGSLLAQGTFTNETGSGWQTLVFSSPVSVTAGTTYIASYVDPNGHYSYNADQFASPITNGPLTAPASSSLALGNDVYSYGATPTFPTSTYNADNFWVDVLFQPAA